MKEDMKLAKIIPAAAIALSALYQCGTAQAQSVNYTVSGWQQQFPGTVTPPSTAPWGSAGYPGDTVQLDAYSGTLNLTVGTSTQKINSLLWNIDYTYGGTTTDPDAWSNQTFNFDAARTISFAGGPSGVLGQTGNLFATWENDFLTFNLGTSKSFLVQGYQVKVTALGIDTSGSNFDGANPWPQPGADMLATFTVTAVPEPETYAMLLSGLGLMGVVVRRRKTKQS
jgi:hypothetical protein